MPTSRPPRPAPALLWPGMAVLYLVWGSTYLGIAIAIETIPPFLMAAGRFVVAGAVMVAIAAIVARRLPSMPRRREWLDSAIVGSLLLGGGMGLVAWGQQSVPSGIAAILIALLPVWIAILGRIALGERLPRAAVAGIALGFVGVAVLVGPVGAAGDRLDPPGVVALLISPVCWAIGSLYAAHRAQLPKNPFVSTGIQMLLGSLILAAMSLATGELVGFRIAEVSAESWAALGYLTLFGSILGFTTYGWLIRTAPLPLVATYAYVNPVVAVFLGWLVLSEPISVRTLAAGAIIIFAVALIITTRSRMTRPVRSASDRQAAVAPPDPAPVPSARSGRSVHRRRPEIDLSPRGTRLDP